MDYYIITDENELRKLPDFEFIEGQSHQVKIPCIGGEAVTQSRKSADLFRMQQPHYMKSVGRFYVIDSDALIYECIGNSISVINDRMTVFGIVASREPVPKREEALKAIAEAKKKIA